MVQGKWKDRDELFQQAAKKIEIEVIKQLKNKKYGDAFTAIKNNQKTRSWEALGLAIPKKEKSSKHVSTLTEISTTQWEFASALYDGTPIVQFSFGAPIDHYSGEVKKIKIDLKLNKQTTFLGAKGKATIDINSLTMGDEGLDEYVLIDVLKKSVFPKASYTFEIIDAPKIWQANEVQQIKTKGMFQMLGKSFEMETIGSLESHFNNKGELYLQLNTSFKLPIMNWFGIEGPDGPSPSKDELDFQVNLLLQKPEQKIKVQNKATINSKTTRTSNENFIKWYASNSLYKAKGSFESWKITEFKLENNDFTTVKAEVTIDIHSIQERSNLLVKHLKGEHFFDANNYPKANIKINGARLINGNKYEANAIAIIKGKKQIIDLSFVLKDKQIIGKATIDREKFGIGTNYKKANGISKTIQIEFKTSY